MLETRHAFGCNWQEEWPSDILYTNSGTLKNPRRWVIVDLKYEVVAPEPASLVESLRSIGYTLPTALADILDNSISAGARVIKITFHWGGTNSYIQITDDGCGMTEDDLRQAMRPGSLNPLRHRGPNDLGRFGLGLKTASFSQCRTLSVVSKTKLNRLVSRTWDLSVLENSPEWRLLIGHVPVAEGAAHDLSAMESGTAVVWSNLDRIVGAATAGSAAAHSRFNTAIDQVREHLSVTFHRFIEDRDLEIFINGQAVKPWNPFMRDQRVTSYATPEEFIEYEKSGMTFQGFILPHKDVLNDEEFRAHGGTRGWTAHQGFYVYRNRRLLVAGDWLRLGRPSPWTKEEQFRLARIRLDILNDADEDWHLDVKKSMAHPPALVRERLTDLAEAVRAKARSVFAHRGRAGGPRISPAGEIERPWISTIRDNRRVYSINRDHPLVKAATAAYLVNSGHLMSLLRLLEETVPVQQIWLDTAEQTKDHAGAYFGLELSIIKADMRRTLEFLTRSGLDRATALARLRRIEPFDRYPELINDL